MKQKIPKKYEGLNPNDVVFTPRHIAKRIVEMFNPSGKVLEPCKGEGSFLEFLPKETQWCEITEGKDFFDFNEKVDWIVTNPPYSKKDEFLKRAYELGKPFAFLLPLTALEGIKRGKLYKKYGLQIIIPNRSINFITPNRGSSSWFATAWFTWGLNLPKDLMFVELNREALQ